MSFQVAKTEYFNKLINDEEFFLEEMIKKKILKAIDAYSCASCNGGMKIRTRIREDNKFFICDVFNAEKKKVYLKILFLALKEMELLRASYLY